MKKSISFLLSLLLTFSAFPVFAEADGVSVTLDGEVIECVDENGNSVSPLLIDATTYLPVRAVSEALGVPIEWDGDTKSVFIGDAPESAEAGDSINIYIDGVKFTAKDAAGKVVTPINHADSVYLPIRAIGTAFDKDVAWDNDTRTAVLTTPDFMTLEEGKTYAFVNKASGKAISVTDSGLTAEKYMGYTYQAFTLTPSETDGYYNVVSIANGKNLDVNANSTAPGASIITYTASNADNQKFAFVNVGGSVRIYARSSKLPIEDSADKIKQNSVRDSAVQLWSVTEVTPVEKTENTVLYTISSNGLYLNEGDSLSLGEKGDNSLWALKADSDGEYIITSVLTEESLDVANNSTTSGDPVITYKTSGDANQRWTLTGSSSPYIIKSVHSSLCLAIEQGTLVQSETPYLWDIKKVN